MAVRKVQSRDVPFGCASYFAFFDPYVQMCSGMRYEHVRRRLFLECLMNDFVFTSLSHILASDISTRLFEENVLLHQQGIVIPYSREHDSVGGLIKDRLARFDSDRELYAKWGIPLTLAAYKKQIFNEVQVTGQAGVIDKVAEEKTAFYDSELRWVASHSPLPGMQTFKEALLYDLRKVERIGAAENKTKLLVSRLMSFIEENVTDRLNRDLFMRILNEYGMSPKTRRRLLDALNFNYNWGYLSNLGWQSVLASPWFASVYERPFDKEPRLNRRLLILGHASLVALQKFVQEARIPSELFDRLTAKDIVELRQDPLITRFREVSRKAVLGLLSPVSSASQESLFTECSRLAKAAANIIGLRAKNERVRLVNVRRVRNFVYWTISLFAAGFVLMQPALAILLIPPAFDILSGGEFTKAVLLRTHSFDLALLEDRLRKVWELGIATDLWTRKVG